MKTMTQKIPDVFVPEDIVADGLLLVGYKLFPATHIALHPRMTVLSGNNAVGKTTILDAVQTILICHQQYINLNVATGQFDRTLSGQLSGRVGWAVLSVSGHEEITAIGVRLHAKATTESLELNPFVLTRIPAATDLFMDREHSVIIPDFQALKRNILHRDIQAQAHDFASVDEYHRYLFAQGLLPVSMDRQGKKKFATLWSQVTRPKLDRLGIFLKQMLCPDPAQGVKFADVERLMGDRRRLSEQISALEKFRLARQELEENRNHLDDRRFLYLSTELGRQRARIRSCEERRRKEQEREARTVQEMQELEKKLEQVTTQKTALGHERDKYLRMQRELSKQKKHCQEYQKALNDKKALEETLETAGAAIAELQQRVAATSEKLDEHKKSAAALEVHIAELKERLKHLKADRDRFLALQDILAKSEQTLGHKLTTWTDVHEAWSRVHTEKARLDGLPELKNRLPELEKRVESHRQAVELRRWFEQHYPQTKEAIRSGRQAFEEVINTWEELDFDTSIARAESRLERLEGDIGELEKGRPSLPRSIGEQVDSGRLSLVASRYEHLDLEQASRVQARLGPFAKGVVVEAPEEISGMELGDEEFMLVTKDVDPEGLTSLPAGAGHISGQGNFYWYAPKSYVWLGAQARARELQRLGREKSELEDELERLRNDRRQNRERINRARQLAPMWPALEDEACGTDLARLKEEVAWLEKEAPAIQNRYRYVRSLLGKSEHFDLHDAPRKCQEADKELQARDTELHELKKSIHELEQDLRQTDQELAGRNTEYSTAGNTLAGLESRIQGLLDEEPLDVLEGRIDFSQAQAVDEKIAGLDQDLQALDTTRDHLTRDNVRKGDLFTRIQDELERLDAEEKKAAQAEEGFVAQWRGFYPGREPEYRTGNYTSEDASTLRIEWEMAEKELKKTIDRISKEYSLQLPPERPPEVLVDMILENIIPSFLELDKVEDQFQRLRRELGEIEARIKSYVQDIKRKVDQEINKLKRRLDKVNAILADIRFGRISQVRIELSHRPHYDNLKKLQGDTLSLLDFGSQTTLQDFVQTLVKNIFRHGQGDLSEEQIADYRTYIDLNWSITDQDGERRHKGFSGGETLGINLAICLGLLFHWGGESGQAQARGLLIMALDEAERLDEQAVYTVRELLDRAESQLLVALPRTIQIPDTVCHMLTPLEQGVTHVSIYHKG